MKRSNFGTAIPKTSMPPIHVIAPSRDRSAILQIVPSLDTGGAERTTIDIAAALAQAGFLPLVASRGGRMVDELREVGAEWIALPVHAKAPQTLVTNVLRLRNLILLRNVQLVHARSRAPAWSGLLAARLTGVPFVTTYHGIYNAKSGIKRFYNSVMARGDVVIANSEWTAAHIGREYRFVPKRLVVIPRGVDFAHFDPAHVSTERVQKLRAEWSVKPNDIVILLPGRLTRWKGQAILIEAIAQLLLSNPIGNLRVVLAGDAQGRSSYESELARLIQANSLGDIVAIAGHVSDMPAAYLAADIVVSASTDPEAFGRVAAEAGAMERPVIAPNHGGAREIVIPGQSGYLFAPGSVAELAKALQQLLGETDATLRAMGAAARAHISARYTVERMCADTLSVYRDLLVSQD